MHRKGVFRQYLRGPDKHMKTSLHLAYLLQTETSFTLFVHIDVTHLSWRDVTNFFVKKGTSFIWAKKITRLSWLWISFDGNTQR